MREIKFRGKSIDTGEWFFGDLVNRNDPPKSVSGVMVNNESVDSKTIGQFAEVKDRNTDGYSSWFTHVQFDTETGSWHRFNDYQIGEIIGNIHDNPKLINA